jgi:hypothetical protein
MRWLLAALFLLFAAGLALTFHPAPPLAGETLAAALESRGPALRGAIPLIDFQPDDADRAAARSETVVTDPDGPPSLPTAPGRRQARTTDAQFVWQVFPTPSPLREALGATSDSHRRVRQALVGREAGSVAKALDAAHAALAALSDRALLDEWVRADRAILAGRETLEVAVRDALLLAAAPPPAPVVTFSVNAGQVFVIPLDPAGGGVWVELTGYDLAGRLAWAGALHVDSPAGDAPPPRRVRQLALRLADVAWADASAPAPLGR